MVDKKTEVTFRTIENLRSSQNIVQDFIKSADKYKKSLQSVSEAGKQFADSLQKVGQLQTGDIGEAINRLAEIERSIETRREQVIRALQEDIISSLNKTQKPEESEVNQFENDYKKSRSSARDQIAKLEGATKKAGKKNPEELKRAIASLNEKIKEADQMKSEKLRRILLIERKKYCNFLTQCCSVVSAQLDVMAEESKLRENEGYWKGLAGSNSQLSMDLEDLVKDQPTERTLVQIQSDGGYDDYSYSSQFSTSYDPPGMSYGGGASLGTASALYDYAGEQDGDLPFYAGDIITIIQEDDGSGWLSGELNGMSGIFPSSYVQRN